MNAAPYSQRGAGTLLATLFLLLIVALLGGIGLRLASTDLNDTAVQNDSVEALFLAESGLERALQRLGAGIACTPAGLGTDGLQTLDRGDFQILSAITVGSLCRVQVRGRVLLGGVMSAQRLIEADLELAGSGTWAVGNGGTILNWNGSAWTAGVSGVASNLNDVTCASSSSCWAVGSGGTVLHWSGGAWTPSSTGIAGSITLNAVACVPNSADDCIAVGNQFGFFGVVYHYSAGTWTSLDFRWFANYTDAFCTTTACYAVGNGGLIGRSGGGWTIETANTAQNLNGVACISASECWAVGPRQGNNFFYDRRTAGGWNPQPVNDPSNNRNLYDVACPASNNCWAVGARRTANTYTLTHWDGSNWATNLVNLSGADDLNAVSCGDGSDCWAVGNAGDALHWAGSGWAYAATGTAQNLNGVYMAGGGGTVSVQRWREIVQ